MKPANLTFTLRWLAQAVSGVMLVILLAIHLIVNHWSAPHGLLTYADVVQYYAMPGIAAMELTFLTVVTVHCLLGLHSIVLDLNLPPHRMRTATWLLAIAGITVLLYGVWLTRTIVLL